LTTDYGYVDTSTRRSVYVPAFRNALPDVFEVFDFADPSVCVGARSTGIIASQALYLLNSPWVATQAQHAARRILEQSFAANDERIRWTYQLILGRSPNPSEMHAVLRHLERHPEGWTHLVHALFASADFRYLD
jgi:hypothetical protein